MKSSIVILVLLWNYGFSYQSEISEKYCLIIFEGSDWCVNCIRLEKNILKDAAFIEYLDQEDIKLIKVDFPQQKKLSDEQKLFNRRIAEKYNFEGVFPTMVISRSDTLLFDKIVYQNQSVEELEAVIRRKLEKLQ